MTIRDELIALTNHEDQMIHADSVVNFAQTHRNSELHGEFEWDDSTAAHQHRLSQARRLIQIHVVFQTTGKRATVSLIPDRVLGGGYRALPQALNNQQMRNGLVRQILDELARVINRYPQLDELDSLQRAIERQRRLLEEHEAAA